MLSHRQFVQIGTDQTAVQSAPDLKESQQVNAGRINKSRFVLQKGQRSCAFSCRMFDTRKNIQVDNQACKIQGALGELLQSSFRQFIIIYSQNIKNNGPGVHLAIVNTNFRSFITFLRKRIFATSQLKAG